MSTWWLKLGRVDNGVAKGIAADNLQWYENRLEGGDEDSSGGTRTMTKDPTCLLIEQASQVSGGQTE